MAPAPAPRPELVVADHLDALVEAAAARIRAVAAAAVAARGRFRVALAGGSTPRALYPELVDGIDWTRAEVFFGDERAVPPDDPQSNYRMARETLLAPARVPEANVFRWQAEAADLDAAARDYEQALRARPTRPGSISRCWGSAPTATRRRCFRAPRRWPSTTASPWRSTCPRSARAA